MSVPRAADRPRARGTWRARAQAFALLITTLTIAACEAGSSYPQTSFRTVSKFGDDLNAVFYNTFAWTMVILVIVVALILYAAVRFRERPDAPHPQQIHGNTLLEIGWTIVPAIIIIIIGVPTVRTIFDTQRRPPDDALVVEVIGHQWWWEFRYPEYELNTANQMYIPTNRPISLVMRSADVVHSFWIPMIGGKRDVNPLPRRRDDAPPAHANYLTFTVRTPGHYTGQCAEFCGEAHAIMRMSVMAVEQPDFERWVQRMRGPPATPQQAAPGAVPAGVDTARVGALPAGADTSRAGALPAGADTALVGTDVGGQAPALTATQPAAPAIGQMPAPTGVGNPFRSPMPDSLLQEEGRRIFLSAACVACHAVSHTTAAGTLGPNLTLFGARPSIGAGAVENNLDNLIRWIREPQAMKPGTLMPGTVRGGGGMAPTGLTDIEVRAIAAYLSSLR